MKNREGRTALHLALDLRDKELRLKMVQLLTIRGADPSVRDINGISPADTAAEIGINVFVEERESLKVRTYTCRNK